MSSSKEIIAASREARLDKRSKDLRKLMMRGFVNSAKGHVGSSFSMIEILRVLYDDIMRFDASKPRWRERDGLIISPGWASLAQYALLADKGYFPDSLLDNFLDTESQLGGCLEEIVPGVEATTGACGHGLSIGVGMAISLKIKKQKAQKVFVIVGDGEHGEGSVWEAAICASRHNLDNLCIIIDYNKVQCSGSVKDLTNLDPLDEKWKAFGMNVKEVNGHNINELKNAFSNLPIKKGKPSVIICHTVMGKGLIFGEDSAEWHWKGRISSELSEEMIQSINNYK